MGTSHRGAGKLVITWKLFGGDFSKLGFFLSMSSWL